MGILATILGFAGTAGSGGIFGVIGGLGSSVMKYFHQKEENKFKEKEWAHKKDLVQMKMDAAVSESSWDALIAGQQAELMTNRWPFVDAVKTLFRITFTAGLFVMVYFLYTDILQGLNGEDFVMKKVFEGHELKLILKYIVDSVTFTATAAGLWWFSERAFAPPGQKNR